jgi:hypothetical protein
MQEKRDFEGMALPDLKSPAKIEGRILKKDPA